MSIVEELRADIQSAVNKFNQDYGDFNVMSQDRARDIRRIRYFLHKIDDPLKLKKTLKNYLEHIRHPVFFFWPFLDSSRLHSLLKVILESDKYKTKAILRAVISEKDQQLHKLLSAPTADLQLVQKVTLLEKKWQVQEEKTNTLELELKLLKKENFYLYQTITALHTENESLKKENKELKISSNNIRVC